MKTSLVIVDYKTMSDTIAYLEHCSRMIRDWRDVSVVIIDNDPALKDSSDFLTACKNAKRIEVKNGGMWEGTLFGRPVYYVRTLTNLGLAKGNNMGAAIAHKYFEPDYLLFSNNDIRFAEPVSLKSLHQVFAENPEAAAVGPAITTDKGECQNPARFVRVKSALTRYYWNLLLPTSMRKHKREDWIEQAQDGFYDYISGSFVMIDMQKFVEIKGFDPSTVLFMEMPILSMRMEQLGYRMYYTGKMQLIHKQRNTSDPIGGPIRHIRFDYQAKQQFYVKYGHLPMAYVLGTVLSFEIFFSLFWIKKTVLNLLGIRN